jgi:short-subunit dehydrogenase
MIDFKQKYGEWAIITGTSSGIGKSFANLLSQAKINTICISNEEEEQKAVCETFSKDYGVECIPCVVDLAHEDFINKVKEIVGDREIGMLICCASFGFVGPFETGEVQKYTDLIHVSVYSYFRLVYEYYPRMLAKNLGAIILTSSVNVASPLGMTAVYTSCKAFELYFGEALRWESRNSNIDIMVLLPGPTRTNFQKKAGTLVTPWAMEPDKVATLALKYLGRKWILITGWRNRLFQFILRQLPIKTRIKVGSKVYLANLKGKKK